MGNAPDFWHRKIGRMEDGKGDKFPSTHTSSQMDTHNPLDWSIQWLQCWVSLRFWGLLALSVSGRGLPVGGAFLMGRSTNLRIIVQKLGAFPLARCQSSLDSLVCTFVMITC